MSQLAFFLITPIKEVFAGNVPQVDVPGAEGDFGVLAEHVPFVTNLRAGVLRIHGDQNGQYFLFGGFAEVSANGLCVLTAEALAMAQLNQARLDDEVRKVELALSKTTATQRRIQLEQLVQALRGLTIH